MDSYRIFQEALSSIRLNKARSALSGFGVAWGIFILTVLLGVGDGFRQGVMGMFDVFAQKSMFIYAGTTSLNYGDKSEGTEIDFTDDDLRRLRSYYSGIEAISPEMYRTGITARNADKDIAVSVCGVRPDYFMVKLLETGRKGRILNSLDSKGERPVAVIGEGIATALFGNRETEGKEIDIDGVFYTVAGVLKSDNIFSLSERNSVYIPAETFRACFGDTGGFRSFCMVLSPGTDMELFEKDVRNYLAYIKDYSTDDDQAVYISNIEAQTSSFESLFKGLNILIWVIGICFLLSGMAGIGNVMLITVKERTSEIGIRKAIGAVPESIIKMIILESVCITLMSGVIGIMAGTGTLFLIDKGIAAFAQDSIMGQVSVHPAAVLLSLGVLVLSGMLSGLFPAVRASRIMPVDAIRYENRG